MIRRAVRCTLRTQITGENPGQEREVELPDDILTKSEFLKFASTLLEVELGDCTLFIPGVGEVVDLDAIADGDVIEIRSAPASDSLLIRAKELLQSEGTLVSSYYEDKTSPGQSILYLPALPASNDSILTVTFRTLNPHNSRTISVPEDLPQFILQPVQTLLVRAGIIPENLLHINLHRIDHSKGFVSQKDQDTIKRTGSTFVLFKENLDTVRSSGDLVLVMSRKFRELYVHCYISTSGRPKSMGPARSVFVDNDAATLESLSGAVSALNKAGPQLKKLFGVPEQLVHQLETEPPAEIDLPWLLPLAACPSNSTHVVALFEQQNEVNVVVLGTRVLQPLTTTNPDGDQLLKVPFHQSLELSEIRNHLRREAVMPPETVYSFTTSKNVTLTEGNIWMQLGGDAFGDGRTLINASAESHKPVLLRLHGSNHSVPHILSSRPTWSAVLQEITAAVGLPHAQSIQVHVRAHDELYPVTSFSTVLPGDELRITPSAPAAKPMEASVSSSQSSLTGSPHHRVNSSLSSSMLQSVLRTPVDIVLSITLEGLDDGFEIPFTITASSQPKDIYELVKLCCQFESSHCFALTWKPFPAEDDISIRINHLRDYALGDLRHPRTDERFGRVGEPIKCKAVPNNGYIFVSIASSGNNAQILALPPTIPWSDVLQTCRARFNLPPDTGLVIQNLQQDTTFTSRHQLKTGDRLLIRANSQTTLNAPVGAEAKKPSHPTHPAPAETKKPETKPTPPSPAAAKGVPTDRPSTTTSPVGALETKGGDQPAVANLNLTPVQQEILGALRALGFENVNGSHAVELSKYYTDVEHAVSYAIDHPNMFTATAAPAEAKPTPTPVTPPKPVEAPKPSLSSSKNDEIPRELLQFVQTCNDKVRPTVLQLLDMKLYIEFPADKIIAALQRSNEIDAILTYLMTDTPEPAPVATFQCTICLSDVPLTEMYIVSCLHSHRFCVTCMFGLLESALIPQDGEGPHIPACPLESQRAEDGTTCHHLMSEQETQQIVDLYCQTSEATNANATEWWTLREKANRIIASARKMWLLKAHRDNGHVRCPNCKGTNDEGFWFLPPGGNMKVTCPQCGSGFCSHCSRSPYHYNTSCDEVMRVQHDWLRWIQEGRERYVQTVAAANAQYQNMLQQYNDQRQKHEAETKAAHERYEELKADEQYKARTCKRCPHCGRIVEKITGCDSMVCGRNYHGGDAQNGCGQQFSWSSAPAYVADIGQERAVEFNTRPPEQTALFQHMIVPGQPFPCDVCHSPIVGPLLRCINCPSFCLCLQCHLQGSGRHPENHTFTIDLGDS